MSMLIRTSGQRKSNFIPPDEAMRRLDELQPSPLEKYLTTDLRIEPDCFVLTNLPYRSSNVDVFWSHAIWENGGFRKFTQTQWAEQLQPQWRLPSAPMVHATIMALYALSTLSGMKDSVDRMVRYMNIVFEKDFMPTSTRVDYSQERIEIVTHDCFSDDRWQIAAKMKGKGGLITPDFPYKNVIKAVLGEEDIETMVKAYTWFSGRPPRLYQVAPGFDVAGEDPYAFSFLEKNSFGIGDDQPIMARPAMAVQIVEKR